MLTLHTIRLRGFWDVATLPSGRTQHRRRFGKPRTLDANESLWLVCPQVLSAAMVLLNGEPVGTSSQLEPLAVDLTAHLQPRNEVVIEVTGEGELQDVVLEIRQKQ